MKELVFLFLATVVAVATSQHYYGPRYPYFGYLPRPYPTPYAKRLLYNYGQQLEHEGIYGDGYRTLHHRLYPHNSYGRQLQGGGLYGNSYGSLYSLYNPYEYSRAWISPYLIRPRSAYYWPSVEYRMARKKNKGNKKGGGGGGGGQGHKGGGGWWYIRDHKGCISGTWGGGPPKGLEREHYSEGGCGMLGHHSGRGQGNGNKYGVALPQKYQGPQRPGGGFGGGGPPGYKRGPPNQGSGNRSYGGQRSGYFSLFGRR